MDNIPSSQQILRSLSDISSAKKERLNQDYLQLKNDYDNLVNGVSVIISAINSGEFSPLSGVGSPEGVEVANYSLMYVDTATNEVYFNSTLGADTGWAVTT